MNPDNMTNNLKPESIIGLEIHVELNTKTKLFCACPTQGSAEPNTRTCPVCFGHPGSKPVVNRKAVEKTLAVCAALGCTIAPQLVFSRKSYFYPDMAKNYQITQYELPLGTSGVLAIGEKKVRIRRVHLEEDPASITYPGTIAGSRYVLVDYNRSGNPLCEIVTEPDLTSPEEARTFMKELITLLDTLNVFDVKDGLIKADCNISVRESGYTRVEIKNVSGFKEIERALEYETARQRQGVREGEAFLQHTRAWDAGAGKTILLRTKETEEDYGYIIDPDLVPVEITPALLDRIAKNLPELPQKKEARFVKEYGLSSDDAHVLSHDKKLSMLFEQTAQSVEPLLAARWVREEVMRVVNYHKLEDWKFDITHFADLLRLVAERKITETVAKELLEKLLLDDYDVRAYVEKKGLEAVSDAGEL
ncbi:Asp-tRNA(Asn)/Glu-tRNA(Gln) amidotransferase GatCAB subunit B, partial [Candidatus Woesearchaeota archaeon CG_4_10_14_0_8_um_filter_47_5]